MRFWARMGRAVRSFVERVTSRAPEPSEPTYDDDPGGLGTGDGEDRGGSRLPDGWVLVGLYHDGEKTTRIHATDDTDVTDSEIHSADALIVWYEDAGGDGYRWVHGATGWDSLADQVERTIVIVSPTAE